MTLGIAAIAAWNPSRPKGSGGEGIVLISDDTYEIDSARIKSPVPKRRGLLQKTGTGRAGWFFLFSSSDTTQIDLFLDHVRLDDRVEAFEQGTPVPTMQQVRALLSDNYKTWRAAGHRFDSDFLVAGFDEYRRPCIFSMDSRGATEDQKVPGHWVTGNGGPYAWTRLVWHETSPSNPLYQVLYKCYDAKRHAERVVGSGHHIAVLFPRSEQPRDVPGEIRVTMSDAFAALEAPVFGYGRSNVPTGWREKLETQVRAFAIGANPPSLTPERD